MKWLNRLLATLFLLTAYPVQAQIVRTDCDIVALTATAIQACWDNAELKWKYWNGTVWVDSPGAAGGTPAGSDTHVQFKDGSVFGGEAGLTYNKTTDVLTAVGGFVGITDAQIPSSIARDSEINVQGTANEITSSGSGVAPTLSIASLFRITGKTATAPVKTGTTAPVTCTIGDLFFDTDATGGNNLFGCTATDTWTLLGDGGGAGSGDITDVWGCASGNCNTLTAAAGDTFDAGTADSSSPATRSTSLPGTCAEGQMHQDTDSGGSETYICTAANTWTKLIASTDNVATTTALAANGGNCSAGNSPLGVDTLGAVEGCFDVATQTELDNHINDTAAAHGASAIAFTPHGSIGSTNLQDALQEVRDEAALASDVFTQTEANAVEFITSASTANLTGERVATDTATIDVDIGTGGQAKWNVVANSIGAAQIDETGNYVFSGTVFTTTTVASLGTATAGVFKIVTDALTAGSCATGGGSVRQVCMGNGTSWVVPSPASTPSLQAVMDVGRVANNAVDLATAHRIGNTVIQNALYCDSSNVCHSKTVDATTGLALAADKLIEVDVGKVFLYADDISGQTPHKLLKPVYWDAGSINVDGTNCASPTEQALNSSEKTWAFSCLDSNSSIFSGKLRMPRAYDGGTIAFTLSLFHGTTETITFAGDFSAQCRAAATAINSTYGTAVAADVAITTANQIAEATTAAVTPNGTCTTAGVWILWRYVVDAANFSANAANAKVLGVTMTYSVKGLSD